MADSWYVDRMSDDASEDINQTGGIQSIAGELGIRMSDWNSALKQKEADSKTDHDLLEGSGIQEMLLAWVRMDNEDMNPLAHIIAIGNYLTLTGMTILSIAGIAAIFTGAVAVFKVGFALALPILIGAYLLVAVLPIILFGNFMFAVIEWVISVFEVVVGMPLWALSLVSISGIGLGKAGMKGVAKLFEIMIRPSVIVISTIASILLFSGAAHYFNRTFSLFMHSYFDSMTGTVYNPVVLIGTVFLYVLTVYSIGNSCYKLIPAIANRCLNWIDLPRGFSDVLRTDFDEVSGMKGLKQAGDTMSQSISGGDDD
jgi:conjugal transfer/type IV secretion protein DotA/TraY